SAAKGVRRHGVDPNRSRNEEVMPNRPRPPPIQLVATATILGTDLRRGYRWNLRPNATRTSSSDFSSVSPPNRSSKASEVQPISMRKLQRAVEARGIHHRANHSFRAKVKSFGVGQNTGETLSNFR
ncbi:hypothetical protein Prudu_008835, partial [Prunus dulcis]